MSEGKCCRSPCLAEARHRGSSYTTLTVARIVLLCGSHWITSVPFLSTSRHVCLPTKRTPVARAAPAPRSRALWAADRSCTCTVYAPGRSAVTRRPARVLSEIVNPGPTESASVDPTAADGFGGVEGGGGGWGRGWRRRWWGRRRPDREAAAHRVGVRVAHEGVGAVGEHHGEGPAADLLDAGRHVDARPSEVEVVVARAIVHRQIDLYGGRQARQRLTLRIRERDREPRADGAGELRVGRRGDRNRDEGDRSCDGDPARAPHRRALRGRDRIGLRLGELSCGARRRSARRVPRRSRSVRLPRPRR